MTPDTYFNLQHFAGEKTEQPTPKRRREARQKGQVVRSNDITSAFLLLFAFLGFNFAAPLCVDAIKECMIALLGNRLEFDFTIAGIAALSRYIAVQFVLIIWPFLLVAFVTSLLSTFLQVGALFSSEPLKLKLSRLNPIEGFKRIFSRRALVELTKALAKVAVISTVVYFSLRQEAHVIPVLLELPLSSTANYIGNTTISVGIKTAIVLVFIGLLDYGFQWWEHQRNLRMTKEEVKEELKQTEGNPEVRARQRELQRAVTRARMMQAVPTADVVVTNPTHYAVALQYDSDKFDAPIIVAKGKGYLAQKIKEIARANDVPIVRDVYVAQTLYKTAEIGDEIPEELYQAVAEILAIVYRMQNRV